MKRKRPITMGYKMVQRYDKPNRCVWDLYYKNTRVLEIVGTSVVVGIYDATHRGINIGIVEVPKEQVTI